MERLETNAAPRYLGQWAARVLEDLRCQLSRVFTGPRTCEGREKDTPMKKRGDLNIPRSPDTAIWYNAAMREAGQRRGF